MRTIGLILFFVILQRIAYCQPPSPYAAVDNYVRNFPMKIRSGSDMRVFIREMTRVFTSDEEKLRAVYFWITENISYDYAAYHNESLISTNPEEVLKSHKAVCSGYAALFQFCCNEIKIQCKTINGVARSGEDDVSIKPDSLKTNHSWNAVLLNGEWKLIDITWASGYADKDVTKFIKKRSDYYCFMSPAKFIYRHLPDDITWQLLKDTVVTQEAFCNQPLVMSGYFENQIERAEPFALVLVKNIGDTISFKFNSKVKLERIQIFSDDKPAINLSDSLTQKEDYYYYNYIVKHTGKYDLEIALSAGNNNSNSSSAGDTAEHINRVALMYSLEVTDQKHRLNKAR